MRTSLKSIAVMALAIALISAPWLAAAAGKVNINTATVEELSLLPRVGPAVAGRIVEFRDKNGNFKRAEDLLQVSGIGDRTFDLIEPFISLEGDTTLSEKVSSSGGTP